MTTPTRTACLFVNARARRGKVWFEQAKSELERLGISFDRCQLFLDGRAMKRAIVQARERKCDCIVVGGGDGTLHQAAGILAQSSSVLGVLPLGTGNAFARDLGVPTELKAACAVIAQGDVQEVDLGIVSGTPFLSVATIGLSAIIARNLDSSAKRWLGPLAYLKPILIAFQRIRPFEVRLTADGKTFIFDCLQLVVGNGRFHAGPFRISDDANLKSGELVVYAVASTEKSVLARYLIALAQGRVESMPQCEIFRIVSGRVETHPSRRVIVDGEVLGTTPIELGILPGALRVFAPASIPGESQSTSS